MEQRAECGMSETEENLRKPASGLRTFPKKKPKKYLFCWIILTEEFSQALDLKWIKLEIFLLVKTFGLTVLHDNLLACNAIKSFSALFAIIARHYSCLSHP